MNRKTLVFGAVVVVALLFKLNFKEEAPVRNSKGFYGKIVAFGDSLTAGYGAPKGKGYIDLLEAAFAVEIKNMARNGETSKSALDRVRLVLRQEPDVVVLTIGGNDLLRQWPVSTTLTNLEAMFERLLESGAMVVYGVVKPPAFGGERAQKIEDLCNRMGVLIIPNIMGGLFLDPALMADQIHPNAKGYAVVAERFEKEIRRRLVRNP